MASDGHIVFREIALIKSMSEKSPLFEDLNFPEEINTLVNKINTKGKEFISNYFDLLNKSTLTENEELILINFAMRTIKADDQIEYSEIKFFKNIRHRLKVSDENILAEFPDSEEFVEEDIVTESYLEKITNQYLDTTEFKHFEFITIDKSSDDDLNKVEL